MCNPAAIVMVVSAVVTARQQQQQATYERGVGKYNTRVAENQAEEVRNVGVEEENIQRRKTAELVSKQRAQLGAAGVALGSGSALQLQQDTATLGEADALRIRSNTEAQFASLKGQAELTSSRAEFIGKAGESQAAGTLLSGAASGLSSGVSSKWFTPSSSANTTG